MKKFARKKATAVMMAATMMVTMTGCGKKSDGGKASGDQAKADTKTMVYEGEEFKLDGIEGDPYSYNVHGDKLYMLTYEWKEPEGLEDEDVVTVTEGAEEDLQADTASEGTEENQDDAASEESDEKQDDAASEESGEKQDDAASEEDDEKQDDADSETEDDQQADENDASEEGEQDAVEETDLDMAESEETVVYENGQSVMRLYTMNLDGSDPKEVPIELAEDEWMDNFVVAEDESLLYLTTKYDQKTDKSTAELVKMGADGKETARVDLNKELKVGEEEYISRMAVDSKGNIVIVGEKLYLLSADFKPMGELKSDGEAWIAGVAQSKDGQIICASEVYKEDKNITQVQVIDVEAKKWGDSYPVELSYFGSSDSLLNGSGDYDFYYKDDSGIYGYVLADKKGTKIMDYVASDLTSDSTGNIIPIGDGRFIGTSYDYESENGEAKIVVYTKVDPSQIADKQTITFGTVWGIDENIKRAAIAFNKESKDYRIDFKDYSSEEDPQSKMSADIIAGNVPDIIDLSAISADQYIAKGLIEDLTPYLEKDSELSESDFIPNVFEAMKKDGKLYYVATNFSLNTLIAKKSDVGDGSGWTFDELKDLLKEKGKDARPFWAEEKEYMLNTFLWSGLMDFVDWQTGECQFDSQDFKDILEICNEKGTNEEIQYDEDTPSLPQLIQEGKVLFADGSISFEEVQVYNKMFGEEVNYIGYPNQNKEGNCFSFQNKLGIYAKSDVKDGAWEFLRTFLTKEYQGKRMDSYSVPIRQDCFDVLAEAMMATEEYVDEFGVERYPLQSGWGWGDFDVEIGPLSQKEVDQFVALVNNTKKEGSADDAIMNIITEEAKPYFKGEKSLDETVDVIQNRVKTYVNENR